MWHNNGTVKLGEEVVQSPGMPREKRGARCLGLISNSR